MRGLCPDEGTLQGYYDGELEPSVLEQLLQHFTECEPCLAAAREVESEMALTTRAFAPELALSVPTERLRARLDEAIAGLGTAYALETARADAPPSFETSETSEPSRVRSWLAALVASLTYTPQRATAFASILAFLVLSTVAGALFLNQRDSSRTANPEVAFDAGAGQEHSFDWNFIQADAAGNQTVNQETASKPHVLKAVAVRRQNPAAETVAARNTEATTAQEISNPLPEERNYLQAIALLTTEIEANGETALKPTLRADYERNLAVVNQAIRATQQQARNNPNNPDATEFLFYAYQSKLDLLSAVAEQSRPLVAER